MIKISIAMTTYNGSKYIVEQLDSLKNQTLPADEVLIFDDGSSDDTPQIVSSYIKENELTNWSFSVNKNNLGFKENFFQAIEKTSGDYIFLCDQDDVWHSNKIEVMIGLLERNKDIQMLCTGFRKIDENSNPIIEKHKSFTSNNGLIKGRIKTGTIKKIELRKIIRYNISPGCTSACTKKCKEFYLKNASKKAPHDWELSLFGCILHGLYFYNAVLNDYRLHENNTIGFADDAQGFNIKMRLSKTQELRMKFLKTEFMRTQAYSRDGLLKNLNMNDKRVLKRYAWFVKQRWLGLTTLRIRYWFKTLLFLPDYLTMVGLRGLVGDFLLIVTRYGLK